MARVNTLKETNPEAAMLLQSNISVILSFLLLAYNAVALVLDCIIDNTPTDNAIKWSFVLVILGAIGVSAWYALVCFQNMPADPMDLAGMGDIALAGLFNVVQLFYCISLLIFFCC